MSAFEIPVDALSVKNIAFQELIIDVIFRGITPPATYYLGLGTGPLPGKATTLTGITEVVGLGYGRIALARGTTDFPTKTLSGDWKVTALSKRFAASGTWTQADFAFLTDVASGTSGRLLGAMRLPESFLAQFSDTYDGIFEFVDP